MPSSYTPGTIVTGSTSDITGTVAPVTSGATWEYYDRYTSAVVGTSLTPNSWGFSVSGTTTYYTIPAGAGQGHDPDGTGRYELRLVPGVVNA